MSISIKEVKKPVVATLQKCKRAPEVEREADYRAKMAKAANTQPKTVQELLTHV